MSVSESIGRSVYWTRTNDERRLPTVASAKPGKVFGLGSALIGVSIPNP
jgi:hypothetical protein